MTDVNVYVNTVDYGDCVIQADIWRDTLNGIGRWEVILDPTGNCGYPARHTLTPDLGVQIQINGVTMMWGFLDDVLPYLDRKGYHTMMEKLTGRDRAMDLAQHQVSGTWLNTAADAIIGNAAGTLLRIIPSDLTRATIGVAPGAIDYEADRTYLGDAIREVCDLVGYDFYVDNTAVGGGNATLNVFAPGASAAAVTLIDFPGSTLNNILHIDPVGEQVGKDIKNYIEGHCGSLSDHYTDINAADWAPTNCAVTNDVAIFLNGKSSIRATQNTGGVAVATIDLDFTVGGIQTNYSYATLNLTEPCIGSYNYYLSDTLQAIPNLNMRLRDNAGNEIEFYRAVWGGLLSGRNVTDYAAAAGTQWRKVDFQLGYNAGIEPAQVPGDTKGHWYQFAGAGFNWGAVDRIRFQTTGSNINDGDFFCIDGLTFPNLTVHSIQQDAASIAAVGQRMKDFYQPNIKNQYELNDFTIRKLAELKDPKETLTCLCIGQTGTPFAGQTLDVVAPDFGIGGPAIGQTVIYRIVRVHHKVVKNSEDSQQPGWTYTTEYDLVRYQYYGTATTQYVEPTAIISGTTPTQSMLRETRIREQSRRRDGNVRLMP